MGKMMWGMEVEWEDKNIHSWDDSFLEIYFSEWLLWLIIILYCILEKLLKEGRARRRNNEVPTL
jgi:hypothetical protein